MGEKIENFKIPYSKNGTFRRRIFEFEDPHGLTSGDRGKRRRRKIHGTGGVTPEVAIKGFGGATLLSRQPAKNSGTVGKCNGIRESRRRRRPHSIRSVGEIGNIIDLKLTTVGRGQWALAPSTISHGELWMIKTNWIGKQHVENQWVSCDFCKRPKLL